MFPAFSASFVQDRNRTALLYSRSVKYLFLVLFPVVLLTVAFAQNGLTLWLGAEFARQSTRVLQWLAVGVFMNCLAQVPFALVQGVGRPDLTAKLHLIELPFYLLGMWWLIRAYGIEGAAIAWTLRIGLDACIQFGIARRFFPGNISWTHRTALVLGIALLAFASAASMQDLVLKGFFLPMSILGFGLASWFLILSPEERTLVQRYL
jgi:O-antigen/teichoic acid export membrane protein